MLETCMCFLIFSSDEVISRINRQTALSAFGFCRSERRMTLRVCRMDEPLLSALQYDGDSLLGSRIVPALLIVF